MFSLVAPLRYILDEETWAHARSHFSNELISRDEGLHAEFACLLYGMLENKLPEDVVHDTTRGLSLASESLIEKRCLTISAV